MSKVAINQRFIVAVNYLISELKSENKSSIADKIKISKSKFSEILKERMNVGLEDLAQFVENFDFDPNWILTGKGEMVRNSYNNTSQNLSEPKIYGGENLRETIETQKELISMQRKRIAELEAKLDKGKPGKANAS